MNMYYINLVKTSLQVNGFMTTVQGGIAFLLDRLLDVLCYNKLPINNNRILFMSNPDYSDNARALYDYMIDSNLDEIYDLIWVVSDSKKYDELYHNGLKCVKRYSIFPSNGGHRFWYLWRTTKYVFHTHGHQFGLDRKHGQKVIGLWHGGMGFKGPMGNNMGVCTDDYILTSGSGDVSLSYVSKFQNCSYDILLPFGNPRNDLLFKYKSIDLFDSIGGKKILWMPTFRESDYKSFSSPTKPSETDLPILHNSEDVIRLNEYLISKNVHIFTTNHPLRKSDAKISVELSNIHTLNTREIEDSGIQLYEIFNHFDAMISDYSSVTFDYLYLNRPIGYTLDDFEEYKVSRGFAMENPLDYMPGHHIYTYDDLVSFVSDVVSGEDSFMKDRVRVVELVGLAEGGKSSEMLLNFLKIE